MSLVSDFANTLPRLADEEKAADGVTHLDCAVRHRGATAATGALIAEIDVNIRLPADWFVRTREARRFDTYREVWQPDLVSALAAVALGMGLAAGLAGQWLAGTATPVAIVAAASVQHVPSRFLTPVSRSP